MKPIVIYPKDNGDKVTLNKKDFEEYLQQAYDAGYSDGYNIGKNNNWWNTPITYPTTNPIHQISTNPNIVPDYTKITCDAHNDM